MDAKKRITSRIFQGLRGFLAVASRRTTICESLVERFSHEANQRCHQVWLGDQRISGTMEMGICGMLIEWYNGDFIEKHHLEP